MKPFHWFSVLFVVVCFQRNEAIPETQNLREDAILFPKVRHVSDTRSRMKTNKAASIPVNDKIPIEGEKSWSGEDIDVSDQVSSEPSVVKKFETTFEPEFIELNAKTELNVNFEKIPVNSSSSVLKNTVSSVKKNEQTVEIDEDTDRLKLEEDDNQGSSLWIYSNIICILLVIGLAIFLIYYPRNEYGVCKNSPSSSLSTSSVSSSSSVA